MLDPRRIQEALEQHRAGRLAEAETAYRAILSADPGNAAATHFLGYLAYQGGHFGAGIAGAVQ
jgi:Tetratricopeptide repeat